MGVIPLCAAPEMTQSVIFVLDFHTSVEKVIPWLSYILGFDIATLSVSSLLILKSYLEWAMFSVNKEYCVWLTDIPTAA